LQYRKISGIFKIKIGGETMQSQRNVEALEDFDTKDYLDKVKDGSLELYENEFALMEQAIDLPPAFMRLEEQQQQMILLYLEPEYLETYSGKYTKDDVFASFLATYKNKDLLNKIFTTIEVSAGTDKDGNAITKEMKVIDQDYMPQYLRLKAYAKSVWKSNNLKEMVKTMREIMSNDGFKDEELLERSIIDDALAKDKSAYTMRNRSLAVKIKGMEKSNALQQINVYVEGGGQKLNRTIIESTGNDNYDLAIEDSEEGEE
jgi:hypothetical protein